MDCEADLKLKNALRLVQEAYDAKAFTLSEEINQLRQLVSNQKQQINTLEHEITHLNRKVGEIERVVAIEQKEKLAILSAKRGLAERYSNLKKAAAQLESFRKSIVNMVEHSPATLSKDLERSFIETQIESNDSSFPNPDVVISPNQSFMGQKDHYVSGNPFDMSDLTIGSPNKEHFQPNSPTISALLPRRFAETAPTKPRKSQTVDFMMPEKSKSDEQKLLVPNPSVIRAAFVDAPTLYKLIRDSLPPRDFDEFAINVAAFNASQQSADVTLRNIDKILKDRELFSQMRSLIFTAMAEASQ
ncbi:hypothetical protein BJ742DRAFT_791941 [Cladochytrium replicatum]|nr:hypothetical protein BJ742DRAFT_791941 [Cladochytrium replicatum]